MNINRFWTRVLSTLLMFISICTTYAIGRRVKDAVISIHVNVEAINTIKLMFILPIALLVMFLYQKSTLNADDKFRDKLRHYMNIPFLAYFIFFGIIEYTNNHHLLANYSPNLQYIVNIVPHFLKSFVTQLANVFEHIWDVLFYVAVEIYGTLILSFSFWQYVNSYTSKKDALILYPYYSGAASLSMIIAGSIGYMVNKLVTNPYVMQKINLFNTNYDSLFHSINIFVMIFFIITSWIGYNISLKEHVSDYIGSYEHLNDNKIKKTMTFADAIAKIKSSKIVLFMGSCVICYMICINLIEVSWKKQVFKYYRYHLNNPQGMSNLYSYVQISVGLLSIISSIIVRIILNRSWLITALVTPIMVGVLGLVFLLSSIIVPHLSTSYLFIPVLLGAIQNAFAKATKYTFFDITKETSLLYVPKQIRDGSKGAIDMIGGRLGKSTGGIIQILLLSTVVPTNLLSSGQEIIAPYVTACVCILSGVWLFSTIMNNKAMIEVVQKEEIKEDNKNK